MLFRVSAKEVMFPRVEPHDACFSAGEFQRLIGHDCKPIKDGNAQQEFCISNKH